MPGIQHYLDNAVEVLNRFGAPQVQDAKYHMAELLDNVAHLDQGKVIAISRVLTYQSQFATLMRENIEDMVVGDRYADIASKFDSIRENASHMIGFLSDGKISFAERLQLTWDRVVNGTIHDRFEEIRKTYNQLATDTKDQIDREKVILEAYADFRLALKDAEGIAYEVLSIQEVRLDAARKAYAAAQAAVSNYDGDQAGRSRLEFKRDEANRLYQTEDKNYQLIKGVAEDLTISYSLGEVILAKSKQSNDLKDGVWRRGVTFFSTSEHVFTALDLAYIQQKGMHEMAEGTAQMIKGMERGIEDLVTIGAQVDQRALEITYGPGISSDPMQRLVDSIIDWQQHLETDKKRLRAEATQNSNEFRGILEEGEARLAEIITNYQKPIELEALPTPQVAESPPGK